jgi:hypothetical protein
MDLRSKGLGAALETAGCYHKSRHAPIPQMRMEHS